jgi:sec-independent protein translocase protein TatA
MELGLGELVVIFAIVLLLFGGSRVAALGGSLGKAVRGFRDAVRGDEPAEPPAAARKELPAQAQPVAPQEPARTDGAHEPAQPRS